jgi:hypothetical protein
MCSGAARARRRRSSCTESQLDLWRRSRTQDGVELWRSSCTGVPPARRQGASPREGDDLCVGERVARECSLVVGGS